VAPFINQIFTGRHNEFLRRLFNMRQSAPAPQVSFEHQPVIIVEGTFIDQVELAYLHRWIYYGGRTTVPAGAAGTNSIGGVFNPANSGKLIVIEWFDQSNSGATVLLELFSAAPAIANVASVGRIDLRNPFPPQPALALFGSNTQVGLPANTADTNHLRLQPTLNGVPWRPKLVLPPGQGAQIISETQAAALDTDWYWRERALETSEQ
jgi:hypothetical protein